MLWVWDPLTSREGQNGASIKPEQEMVGGWSEVIQYRVVSEGAGEEGEEWMESPTWSWL